MVFEPITAFIPMLREDTGISKKAPVTVSQNLTQDQRMSLPELPSVLNNRNLNAMNVGSVSITASNNQRHHTEVDLRTVNQKSTLYHPPEGPRKWFIDEDFESVIPESYYLDNIEKFMRRDKGLEDTYRKSHRSITYGDKLEEIDARRRGIKRAYDETSYMPNYATVLPEHYFKNLRHVDLPSVGTYERLYTSRTGKTEVPNVLREADRPLASPGHGERVNRLTG
jgi:hypothetical protein